MTVLRPLEWGFPYTVSRNTDIPKFWMKRWFEWVDRGYVNAAHPQTGLPASWSLKPEDVHSIVWWSKDYRPFIRHKRREELDRNYRQFFNMTITGDALWEKNVPKLDVQLGVFKDMVEIYGAEKLRWRYSPIPLDWNELGKIADFLGNLGVKECYYSFLHSGTKIEEPRSLDEKLGIVVKVAERLHASGMNVLGCWDDTRFTDAAPNIHEARCVDADVIDRVYGIDHYHIRHPVETSCGCSTSIEVANQTLLACPHACAYCYAAVSSEASDVESMDNISPG